VELFSDPFKDLDVPSSDLAVTTNPVPFGAKYPPSAAQPSTPGTRRVSESEAQGESTDPDPAPAPKK
jgi:hypothetical protein